VAHCVDTACTQATISTVDGSVDVGRSVAIAMGTDGRGIIAYADDVAPGLRVAHCHDAACSSATVTTVDAIGAVGDIRIAIGQDGLPLVADWVLPTGSPIPRLRTTHCSNTACTQSTTADLGTTSDGLAMAIGTDGRGLLGLNNTFTVFPGFMAIRRCADAACTALATPPPPESPLVGFGQTHHPSLVLAGDGRPLGAFFRRWTDPVGTTEEVLMTRCSDPTCLLQASSFAITVSAPSVSPRPLVAVQPNGLGWFAYDDEAGFLRLRTCTNAECTVAPETCALAYARGLSLSAAGDGQPLIAFSREGDGNGLGVVHGVSAACQPARLDAADASAVESPTAVAAFAVSLTAPAAYPITVAYATADGTALAGLDYLPRSGTLTFAPGQTVATVLVPVLADDVDEPDETFALDLSAPTSAVLGNAHAVGTIVDGTPPPELVAGDCEKVEGDGGTSGCAISVALDGTSVQLVTVDYATADGTATGDADYLASAGTLTFTPGTASQSISVSVVGDVTVELDETFFVNLSNAVNATIGDGQGQGLIVDDDAPSLSSLELTHGARVTADLAAAPGPVADTDAYRLAQGRYSSWEVVVDEVSGDVAPGLLLERLAEDNSTVLQTGAPVGTGPARALRWQRRAATPEVRHHIRVRSTSCTTDCGADDTYRLRAYETTGVIPRFNNSGSQITVLILQSTAAAFVQAHADFWSADGTLAATVPVPLGPNAVGIVNTATVPTLAGISGSVTVTHDGPYGAVVGKAVALEPSSGFSFDSPMIAKPR
jgi:hypothetical protein